MFTFNWGRIAGWTGITITYIVYSVAFYFFVYRLGWRWFWTSEKWSAAIILYPTIDIAVRMLMGVWSHIHCCISDPGIIQRPKRQLENLKTSGCDDVSDHCKKCDSGRPKRTHHCSTCNACIYQMDHHCPWVNNCVGIGNQKAFILFLAYTSSAAIECLGLAALRLVTCPNVYNSVMVLGLRFIVGESHVSKILSQENFSFDETCDFKIDYAVIGIVAILCAAIFTIFIAFIATDQIQSIVRNQTFVESLKAGCLKAPETKSPVEIGARLKEVMGSNPSLGWLLPMRSTCWKDSLRSTWSDDGETRNKDASVRGS